MPPPRRFSGAASTTTRIRLPMRVWDLPTRLFHWLVVLLVAVGYASANLVEYGPVWMRVHLLSGYAMAALLLFRLVWGFAGSETARFSAFVVSPVEGLRHLRQFGTRAPDDQVGHNQAGGWAVLAMLLLLAVVVVTGLFANSGGGLAGPLARRVAETTSDTLSTLHAVSFKLLLGLIALHVLAIVAYAALKGHQLLWPMVTGKKRLPAAARAPRMASIQRAVVVFAIAAAAVATLVTLA